MFALIVPGARNVIFFALCTSAVIFGVSAALLTGVGPGRISKFSNVFHSRIPVYSRLCGGEVVAQERSAKFGGTLSEIIRAAASARVQTPRNDGVLVRGNALPPEY